jgi:hypothetical protein
MTFCLLKYEIARFMQAYDPRMDGVELRSSNLTFLQGEKHNVSSLESFLEEKFLRFCDPVVGVQLLTSTLARSNLSKLRQMEHRKISQPNAEDERTTSLEQSNRTLKIATRNIEYDNLIHSSRSLRGFLWHVHFHFPWGAPIVILKLLASHAEWNPDMHAAWTQIMELHEHHPDYQEDDKVIHLIIRGLTLRAWAAQEAAVMERGLPKPRTPSMITLLQARQAAFLTRQENSRAAALRVPNNEFNFADLNGFDQFDLADMTFDETNWASWGNY